MACANHPETMSGLNQCAGCGAAFCGDCLVELGGKFLCVDCKAEYVKDIKSGSDGESELGTILKIAKAQRGVLWCVLINLLGFAVPAAFIVVLPLQLYFVYKLAQALKAGAPILWLIGMFIPLFSLLLLLVLSGRATTAIQKAGFRVGLMGASIKKIRAAMGS